MESPAPLVLPSGAQYYPSDTVCRRYYPAGYRWASPARQLVRHAGVAVGSPPVHHWYYPVAPPGGVLAVLCAADTTRRGTARSRRYGGLVAGAAVSLAGAGVGFKPNTLASLTVRLRRLAGTVVWYRCRDTYPVVMRGRGV